MSAGDIDAVKSKNNKKSRRRKKRRTADSSDSESSSSSSDNESITIEAEDTNIKAEVSDVELSDNDVEMGVETHDERLSNTTKDKLLDIPFTTTDLTQRGGSSTDRKANIDLKKVNETVQSAKLNLEGTDLVKNALATDNTTKDLKNEYLELVFQNYGEDINALREAPDFTTKSLVLLANVLKDGTNMFDTDNLKTILDSK